MPGELRINKATERAINDLFRSRAESQIYLFLLRKKGARSIDIIRGTHLHPSTVRELLARMHTRRMIIREKQKNDHIGKNPYLYRAIPPLALLKRYAHELETRLNHIAALDSTDTSNATIRIQIQEGDT
ncbi:MAG: helix-turn-helix domain-containing protein [Candidatus Thermoplasmatota archaeon]|nr:helix-turn-helix domain-containing protein [Candidatus Thermoplasmatota archaeon]